MQTGLSKYTVQGGLKKLALLLLSYLLFNFKRLLGCSTKTWIQIESGAENATVRLWNLVYEHLETRASILISHVPLSLFGQIGCEAEYHGS